MWAMEPPQPYTLAEACRILGISDSTGFRLIAHGRFPVPLLRIGSAWKVARPVLDAYLAGRHPGSGVEEAS